MTMKNLNFLFSLSLLLVPSQTLSATIDDNGAIGAGDGNVQISQQQNTHAFLGKDTKTRKLLQSDVYGYAPPPVASTSASDMLKAALYGAPPSNLTIPGKDGSAEVEETAQPAVELFLPHYQPPPPPEAAPVDEVKNVKTAKKSSKKGPSKIHAYVKDGIQKTAVLHDSGPQVVLVFAFVICITVGIVALIVANRDRLASAVSILLSPKVEKVIIQKPKSNVPEKLSNLRRIHSDEL